MGMRTPADRLEAARAGTDGAALHRLARSPYVFVRHALAANPATAPATLLEPTPAEVRRLASLNGASARLRRGSERRLASVHLLEQRPADPRSTA